MQKRVKISKGGQVSIPADIRRRWETTQLVLIDEGDRLVLAPSRADAIDNAAGALRGYFAGNELVGLRDAARAEEEDAQARRAT